MCGCSQQLQQLQQRRTRCARSPHLPKPAHRHRLRHQRPTQHGALQIAATAAAAADFGAAASALTGAGWAATAAGPGVQLDLAAEGMEWRPLCMSLLAGLATGLGGLIAVTLSPDEGTLAFLLGTAIGVMACVSGVELWWHSAVQLNDWVGVSAAVLGGAALFAVLDPLLPKPPETEELLEAQQPLNAQPNRETSSSSSSQHHTSSSCRDAQAGAAAGAASPLLQTAAARLSSSTGLQQADVRAATDSSRITGPDTSSGQGQKPAALKVQDADAVVDIQPPQSPSSSSSGSKPGAHRQKSLLRLSLLMAVTMTIHNAPEVRQAAGRSWGKQGGGGGACSLPLALCALPHLILLHSIRDCSLTVAATLLSCFLQGFAVAFSAFTDIGWIMVLAIGLHNISEGLICAAPLYAATRSKWKVGWWRCGRGSCQGRCGTPATPSRAVTC